MKTILLLLSALLIAVPALRAEDSQPQLSRDESAVFKKKLNACLEALGEPPTGYAKIKDDFDLPTEPSVYEGKRQSLTASVRRELGAKAVKEAQKDMNDAGIDYQKKMAAAQMTGNYAEVARLAQELQAKSGAAQMKMIGAQEQRKLSMNVAVMLNTNSGREIDPDNVVFEKPGVIALRIPEGDESEGKGLVAVDFDPVALKDTKKISRSELRGSGTEVGSNTKVLSASIELRGTLSDCEAWAKKLDTAKVLALLDKSEK